MQNVLAKFLLFLEFILQHPFRLIYDKKNVVMIGAGSDPTGMSIV